MKAIIGYNVCKSLAIYEGLAHNMSSPNYNTLYEITEGQAGYFTARQAGEAGYSWERLSYYAKTGRFQRVSHGIYRLVHFPSSPFEDLYISWLRTGLDSVISHESALSIYDLSDIIPSEIHITVPRTASRRRRGIRLHTNRFKPEDVTWREGLKVTTVPRTIADVAATGLAKEFVHQAIQQAIQRGLTDRDALLEMASRRGGRPSRLIAEALAEER